MRVIENTKRLMRTQIVEITQDEVKTAVAQFVKGRLGMLPSAGPDAAVTMEADELGGGARVVVTSEVAESEQVKPVQTPLSPTASIPEYSGRPVFGHD